MHGWICTPLSFYDFLKITPPRGAANHDTMHIMAEQWLKQKARQIKATVSHINPNPDQQVI